MLLLDQNPTPSLFLKQFVLACPRVRYIYTNTQNKSVALNDALALAQADVVAFTDDDCVVSKQWINEIVSVFSKQKDVAVITGNTYPYKDIPRWSCPPTMTTKTSLVITPTHHKNIGYGNNYAIRKNVFKTIGIFRTWLGPGSISTNCEDGEMLLRAATHHLKILHNQDMIVYHNKQLTVEALKKQQCSYIFGETVCYMFYTLHGWRFAKRVVQQNFVDSVNEWKNVIKKIIRHQSLPKEVWVFPITALFVRLKGVCIGTWYFLTSY